MILFHIGISFVERTYTLYNDLKKGMIFMNFFHACQQKGISIEENIPLKSYSTLHIGGNARYFTTPSSYEEIQTILVLCKQYKLPYFILGNGSNILFDDEGYQGVIIYTAKYLKKLSLLPNHKIRAQCGVSLKELNSFALANSLSSLEFSCGIPGSVGGAVIMNAGAYGSEIKDVILEVVYLDENFIIQKHQTSSKDFAYRQSIFAKHQYVILEATFQLHCDNVNNIQSRIHDLMKKRYEKQPMDQYSAGSTFKRPAGNYASALIQQANLQGLSVGDAMVSLKHAGFLINKGNATSKQFLKLIQKVQDKVKAHSGYDLECEIKYIKSDQ